MRRRDFLTGIVVSSTVPLTARAQQPGKLPTIGFLGASPSIESDRVAAFVQRLRELAWIDGRNVPPTLWTKFYMGRDRPTSRSSSQPSLISSSTLPPRRHSASRFPSRYLHARPR